MRKGRKFLCLLLCAVLLLSMSAAALGANNKYSSWFQTNYDEINKLGLMPESFNGLDLTKNITRGEMCELAVYAFEKATGNDIDMSNETFSGFTDTSDQNIIKAHLYGIVNGYEDGSFRPNQLLTRQEFFKLIENFCTAAAFSPKATDGALSGFADAGSISAWAKEAAQICVSYSYVQGTKLGNGTYLNPKSNASRQEAMTMFLRCYKTIQWFYDENVKSATVVVDQINLNVTVTSINKTMYVCQTGYINVRDSWTTGSTKVGELSYNAAVTVTGITTTTSDGHQWYRIKYNGITAYVRADLLSDEKDSTVTPGSGSGSGSGSSKPGSGSGKPGSGSGNGSGSGGSQPGGSGQANGMNYTVPGNCYEGMPVCYGHRTGNTVGGSAYPWSQCTWYAYRRRVYYYHLPTGSYMGNGQDWANTGRSLGYLVNRTPHVGAAMVFRAGQLGANRRYGHVAVVERVNSDGSVLISECGASLQGVAQWRTIYNAGNFQYVHY